MKGFDRLFSVASLLSKEGGITVQELLKKEELGYSSRSSIYADFENIRKNFGLDVEPDEESKKRGISGKEVIYKIDKGKWDKFREKFINRVYTDDEKLRLSFMFESLSSNSPLFSGVNDDLVEKIKSNITFFDSKPPSPKGYVSFSDNSFLLDLLKAEENKSSLFITYYGKRRKLFPLKTFYFSGGIYTYVMNKDGFVYTIALQRIDKIEKTSLIKKKKEERPTPIFDVEEMLSDPFGIVTDHRESFLAVIKLSSLQGSYEEEKSWPNSVSLENKGDYYLFSVSTHGEYWLTRWVLSLGEIAEVLEPSWLRENIKERLLRMSAIYG